MKNMKLIIEIALISLRVIFVLLEAKNAKKYNLQEISLIHKLTFLQKHRLDVLHHGLSQVI